MVAHAHNLDFAAYDFHDSAGLYVVQYVPLHYGPAFQQPFLGATEFGRISFPSVALAQQG